MTAHRVQRLFRIRFLIIHHFTIVKYMKFCLCATDYDECNRVITALCANPKENKHKKLDLRTPPIEYERKKKKSAFFFSRKFRMWNSSCNRFNVKYLLAFRVQCMKSVKWNRFITIPILLTAIWNTQIPPDDSSDAKYSEHNIRYGQLLMVKNWVHLELDVDLTPMMIGVSA